MWALFLWDKSLALTFTLSHETQLMLLFTLSTQIWRVKGSKQIKILVLVILDIDLETQNWFVFVVHWKVKFILYKLCQSGSFHWAEFFATQSKNCNPLLGTVQGFKTLHNTTKSFSSWHQNNGLQIISAMFFVLLQGTQIKIAYTLNCKAVQSSVSPCNITIK